MGTKLFVGSISYHTSEEGLQSLFSQVGPVVSAKIITDRDSGRSKGFGFVEMSTEEDAAAAIEQFHNSMLDGRQIVVSEAKPMQPRSDDRFNRRPRPGHGAYSRGTQDRAPRYSNDSSSEDTSAGDDME